MENKIPEIETPSSPAWNNDHKPLQPSQIIPQDNKGNADSKPGTILNIFKDPNSWRKIVAVSPIVDLSEKKIPITTESITIDQEDEDLRTIIHRSCYHLKYEIIWNWRKQLNTYRVNKVDKYGNTPLILVCKIPNAESTTIRGDIIKILWQSGAYIHSQQPINGWTPLHWACFNGDVYAVKILCENGAVLFTPSNDGYWPIDLASLKEHHRVVQYLINKFRFLLNYIGEFEEVDPLFLNIPRFIPLAKTELRKGELWSVLMRGFEMDNINNNNNNNNNSEEETITTDWYVFNPFIQSIFIRWMLNHSLFWASYFKLDEEIINRFIYTYRALPHYKLFFCNNQTPLHAACSGGNTLAFQILFNEFQNIFEPGKEVNKEEDNALMDIPQIDAQYKRKIKHINEKEFKDKINELKREPIFNRWNPGFANKLISDAEILIYPARAGKVKTSTLLSLNDNYGINPINLAAKYGKDSLIEYIVKHPSKIRLDEYLSLSDNFGLSGYYYLKNEELQDKILLQNNKQLFPIPLVVLELKKTTKTISSINLLVKIAVSVHLKVMLMEHNKPDYIYMLLDIEYEEFLKQAEKQEIFVKLLDYNLKVPFKNNGKFIYQIEPFVSSHYQYVISYMLANLVDLDMLKNQKILTNQFFMHKPNATQKIFNSIIKKSFYWPNPLCFFGNFFWEGKEQIFKEINLWYRYFGEAAAIYYSFYGFYTIQFSLIAVVSLIYVFIYLSKLFTSDDIYPTFFVIFTIWNVFYIERWQRKEAEIQHKWGIVTTERPKEVRVGFHGDEYYRDINYSFQKQSVRYATLNTFLISLPFIILLLTGNVLVFYFTTEWEQGLKNPSFIFMYLPSIVRSVGLVIISLIYDFVAQYTSEKENHKYTENYNRTLIVKIFAFRFIADLTSVCYIAIVQKNIFNWKTTWYTNLIIKYWSEIGMKIILPYFKLKFFKKKYFTDVIGECKLHKEVEHKDEMEQSEDGKYGKEEGRDYETLRINNHNHNLIDPIDSKDTKRTIPWNEMIITQNRDEIIKGKGSRQPGNFDFYRRVPAICCSQTESQSHQFNFNPDFIEISNTLDVKGNLVYDYADILIIYTECCLFAIIIPFAPVIILVFSIISQNGKLYSDLYYTRRAPEERCKGIGLWWKIINFISTFSIVVNCFLFYYYGNNFWTQEQAYTGSELNLGNNEQSLFWLLVIEHGIIFIQFIIQISLNSSPYWVQKEIENLADYASWIIYQNNLEIKETDVDHSNRDYQKEIENLKIERFDTKQEITTIKNEAKKFRNLLIKQNEEITWKEIKLDLLFGIKNKCKKLLYPRIRHWNVEPNGLKQSLLVSDVFNVTKNKFWITESAEGIDIKFDKILGSLLVEATISKNNQIFTAKNLKNIYFFHLLFNTFNQIEKDNWNNKMKKIILNIEQPVVVCDYCLKRQALFYCENCNEILCFNCKILHLSNPWWENHVINYYTIPKIKNMKHAPDVPSEVWADDDSNGKFIKMETFSFPVRMANSLAYKNWVTIFKFWYTKYIENNGILDDNIVDIKNYMQIKWEEITNIQSNINIQDEINELLSSSMVNCEEIYFINRACFSVFKRYGSDAKIEFVYYTLKAFQNSTFEEKLRIWLSMLDIYDNKIIMRKEVEELFIIVTWQAFDEKYKIDNWVKYMFKDQEYITYKDLYNWILNDEHLRDVFIYITEYVDAVDMDSSY